MLGASFLESGGAILTVVTPLVAVPLTVITFYLRSLREHQVSRHTDVVRHVDALEASLATLRQRIAEFERDFTTKEEWLRECMLARRTLEHLREKTARLETVLQHLDWSETGQRTSPARRPVGTGTAARMDDSAGDGHEDGW